MKEVLELRVNLDFAHLLFSPKEGRRRNIVQVITLTRDDPRCAQLPRVCAEVTQKYGSSFFWGWDIRRSYSRKELETARLFHVRASTTFEPAGEECGTTYDESTACCICGAGARQVGSLRLRRRSIPKMDIARTIVGEVIASEAFDHGVRQHRLKGVSRELVDFSSSKGGNGNYYQLSSVAPALDFGEGTVAGVNPFDLSTANSGEIFKCPKGHTLGLNLVSEPRIVDVPFLDSWDFYETTQNIGVRRGLLRPQPIHLCSPRFRSMVVRNKLKGFRFEVAHIVPHRLSREIENQSSAEDNRTPEGKKRVL